jgi:hypothetical protein
MGVSLLNLYELKNLSHLRADYRLVTVDGFIGRNSDVAEDKLRSLTEQIAYAEHIPIAIVTGGASPVLAVPASHVLTTLEYQLTPEVVTLHPQDECKVLRLTDTGDEARRVGESFLKFYLRQPLRDDPSLWSAGANCFLEKQPINAHDSSRRIDVYRGFAFGFRWLDDKLYAVLNPATRYVESDWLTRSIAPERLREMRLRRCLYHFGQQWYPVQVLEVTQQSIRAATFPDRSGETTNVFDYTQKAWRGAGLSWIANLDPESPAILYRGSNRKQRNGAASLCKLTVHVDDPRLIAMRIKPGLPPEPRFSTTADAAQFLSGRAKLQDIPIYLERKALRRRLTAYRIPSLEFGHGKRLDVVGMDGLRELGRSRMELLCDRDAGFAVTGPMSRQYLIVPKTLARAIVDDFSQRVAHEVRQFINVAYAPEQLIYDDESAHSLRQQVGAVVSAVDRANAHGHGILILPRRSQLDLHNLIKRRLHSRLQLQCAMAGKLEGFYVTRPDQDRVSIQVRGDQASVFRGYVRNTTLGLMIANRNWGWVLAEPLHADCYIGFDVLHHMACFVFLYNGGRQCIVRTIETHQKEQLTRQQLRATITRGLQQDIEAGARPTSIVLQRDGRLFESEWQGFRDAIGSLQSNGALGRDVRTAGVAISKSATVPVRMVDAFEEHLENPRLGLAAELGMHEGILCTTGRPFRVPGTCTVLNVRVVRGDFSLAQALEDTFRLSLLSWAAPDKSMRLPITLKLCDDFLRSIAGAADEGAAEFGEEGEDIGEAPEESGPSAEYAR